MALLTNNIGPYKARLTAAEAEITALKTRVLTLESGSGGGTPTLTALEQLNADSAGLATKPRVAQIFWGQSNAQGSGNGGTNTFDRPGDVPPQTSKWWSNGQLRFMQQGSPNNYRNFATDAIYYALKFEEDYPNLELVILEVFQGGAGFEAGAGPWAVGGTIRTTYTQELAAFLNFIKASDVPTYYQFLFGSQGEADRAEAFATAYSAQVQNLLTETSTTVGTNERAIFVRLHPDAAATADGAVVRTVHETIGVDFIDTDDLTLPDGLHYLQDGHRAIGERLAAQSKSLALYEIPLDSVTNLVHNQENLVHNQENLVHHA